MLRCDQRGGHRRRDDPGLRRRRAVRRSHRRSPCRHRADAQIRGDIIGAFLFPLGEVFSVVTIASIVAVGVAIGPAGGLTAGALVGFVFLTYRFLEPIAEFTEVLDQTQTAVAGLRRVFAVLDMPVGPPPPPQPATDAGRAASTSTSTTSRSRTAAAPTAGSTTRSCSTASRSHIPAGQQVAVIGATGSGKTTLGRLIARFADPIAGEIRLGGVPLAARRQRRAAPAAGRGRAGAVPVRRHDRRQRPVRAARRGSRRGRADRRTTSTCADWVEALPDGLDTRVGERGDSLSAGERQLVALLRAGVADPDVLVLDEATSSVDALTEVRTSRALAKFRDRPHHDRDRPPAVDRSARRPGAGARGRPPRRGRSPRRARRRRRHVRPPVRRLAVGDLHLT